MTLHYSGPEVQKLSSAKVTVKSSTCESSLAHRPTTVSVCMNCILSQLHYSGPKVHKLSRDKVTEHLLAAKCSLLEPEMPLGREEKFGK